LADGWHSLSDGVTGAVAWIGFALGSRPPDDDHHYGHGNLEALAARNDLRGRRKEAYAGTRRVAA
jgi:divalent metal cation (Fe/Co/Zn/Cd) transporter